MKRIIAMLTKQKTRKVSQQEILDFMMDEKTIDKAAKGSMQKRLDLLE